ncbi:MAG: hypothetical protein WAV28_13725 [Sedimentisphaerales bacterium]
MDRINSDDKFEEMLGRALRSSSEPVPDDFSQRMLGRIRQAQEQKILAHVILQERLALAGCIVFGAAAIIAVLAFPETLAGVFQSIAGSFTQRGGALVDRIPQTIEAVRGQWQLYTGLAVMAGFAVYSLVDLFAGDKLRMA